MPPFSTAEIEPVTNDFPFCERPTSVALGRGSMCAQSSSNLASTSGGSGRSCRRGTGSYSSDARTTVLVAESIETFDKPEWEVLFEGQLESWHYLRAIERARLARCEMLYFAALRDGECVAAVPHSSGRARWFRLGRPRSPSGIRARARTASYSSARPSAVRAVSDSRRAQPRRSSMTFSRFSCARRATRSRSGASEA